MKKNLLAFLFFCVAIGTAYSQTHWKVDKSAITFKIKNAGITVTGSLGGLIADINFDTANYFKSTMTASIDVNTINMDNRLMEKHLKKEEFFDVDKYPAISLRSSFFVRDGKGGYTGYFKLTIKGVTKDIVIPFSYSESGSTSIFQGSFSINRRDYTVGGNSLILSDNVEVSITINAVK
jgi:polyisoprenoid-binding protein YceI